MTRHATPARFETERVRNRRSSARVGGSSRQSPTMSVMKPGVSSSAPPRMIIAPSKTSRPGHPALGEGAVEALPRRPALRAGERGADEAVHDQQRQGGQDADRAADLDDHVELRDREHDEEQDQREHGYQA